MTVEERIEEAAARAKAAIHAEVVHHHRSLGQVARHALQRWLRETGRVSR